MTGVRVWPGRSLATFLAAALATAVLLPPAAEAQQEQPKRQQQQNRAAKPQGQKPPAGQAAKPAAPPNYDALPPSQVGIGTLAKQAYIIDASSDAVLLLKDGDKPMHPSSMAKLMTIYIVFEELKAGRLKPDSRFRVSERAWRMAGSKMFVDINTEVTVDELLKGIIVQSGNDACVVVAEGLSGTDEAFAQRMTQRGKEMGLTGSVFKNSSGWPADGQYVTARDLAVLAKRTIDDFPDLYRYYAIAEYTYNGISQENRNRLLKSTPGTDGLKTGHTEEAGYGVVSSTTRDGRRMIVVVNGLANMAERARETERLTEWAFREHANTIVLKPGEKAIDAKVWLGETDSVPLTTTRQIVATTPVGQQGNVKVTVSYDGPLAAPIAKGQTVGKLVVGIAGGRTQEFPLIAAEDVPKLGPFGRSWALIRHYLFGWLG
jgi:D-alanyl-D-alanine carboxypeptidase (penicillin-binding protein 5/6)